MCRNQRSKCKNRKERRGRKGRKVCALWMVKVGSSSPFQVVLSWGRSRKVTVLLAVGKRKGSVAHADCTNTAGAREAAAAQAQASQADPTDWNCCGSRAARWGIWHSDFQVHRVYPQSDLSRLVGGERISRGQKNEGLSTEWTGSLRDSHPPVCSPGQTQPSGLVCRAGVLRAVKSDPFSGFLQSLSLWRSQGLGEPQCPLGGQTTQDVITKYYRLGGLNNRDLSVTFLEAGGSRIKMPCWPIWFLGRVLFLVPRWLGGRSSLLLLCL